VSRSDDPDDRALVARFARARDEESFRALYRRHTPALYGLALRLLGHRADAAQDAVQDAWIRAVAGLAGFRWEAALRTWLSGIVVNCCRERLRGEWRWASDENLAPEAHTDAPPPLDLTLDLDRALARLPPGARSAFVLHEIEGFTHEEIAALLEVDPGTSKSQLFHARRQLRLLLHQGTRT
jgi:RNA polymerase sigma-70 factor (ECF subfamily)